MVRRISLALLLAATLSGSIRADDVEEYQTVYDLLRNGQIEEAEKVFAAAVEKYPNSPQLFRLHRSFYSQHNREERYDAALKSLRAYIDNSMVRKNRFPANWVSVPYHVPRLREAYEKAGRADQAEQAIDKILAKVQEAAERGDVDAMAAARELRNQQFLLLAERGDPKAAKRMLATELARARAAVELKPDDIAATLDVLTLLKGQVELSETVEDGDVDTLRKAHLESLTRAAEKHPDQRLVVAEFVNEHVDVARNLAPTRALDAEKVLQKVAAFANSLDKPSQKANVLRLLRSADRLQRQIEASKARLDLVGTNAFPITADAWVNGQPLTDEDLEGKVVLLDFWAVWCGPCIATFPHLRRWQDKYADEGLVVIGVTQYHQFGWNTESGKVEQEVGISRADERAAAEAFARHHELNYRLMYTPEKSLQESYLVNAIPQMVLIDRQGKIRLVCVGGYDEHIRRIEETLGELIATD